MTRKVAGYPQGPDKTVFKLQAFDWKEKQWVDSSQLLEEMRAVLAAGGRHLAYYPDNFWVRKPQIDVIQYEMSTQTIKDVIGYGN
jgi:biofilm PGA synthesis lipoprotein PgaB